MTQYKVYFQSKVLKVYRNCLFLAATAALEVQMSVCLCVCHTCYNSTGLLQDFCRTSTGLLKDLLDFWLSDFRLLDFWLSTFGLSDFRTFEGFLKNFWRTFDFRLQNLLSRSPQVFETCSKWKLTWLQPHEATVKMEYRISIYPVYRVEIRKLYFKTEPSEPMQNPYLKSKKERIWNTSNVWDV